MTLFEPDQAVPRAGLFLEFSHSDRSPLLKPSQVIFFSLEMGLDWTEYRLRVERIFMALQYKHTQYIHVHIDRDTCSYEEAISRQKIGNCTTEEGGGLCSFPGTQILKWGFMCLSTLGSVQMINTRETVRGAEWGRGRS